MSAIAYVINLSMREEGVRNPQNRSNVVYECPLGLQPVEVEMKPRYTCKHPKCGKHFMTIVSSYLLYNVTQFSTVP